jgi:3-keto-L-gulonate-6-phosphate decarboxylase
MNDTTNHEGCKVEAYNYGSDFQLLTLKEKREVLKNAKSLLKLQRDNDVLVAVAGGVKED